MAMVIVRFQDTSCLGFVWRPRENFHVENNFFWTIYVTDFIPVPLNSTAFVFITQTADGKS